MHEKKAALIRKLSQMDAWQLAQFNAAYRCSLELSEEDFSKLSDMVLIHHVPIFAAAESFGIVIMPDKLLSIPACKGSDPA